jgi:hypothetical protein
MGVIALTPDLEYTKAMDQNKAADGSEDPPAVYLPQRRLTSPDRFR